MTKEKAKKLLTWKRETLDFWRDEYVRVCRETSPVMDVKNSYLAGDFETLRDKMKREAIDEIRNAKERIANLERLAI